MKPIKTFDELFQRNGPITFSESSITTISREDFHAIRYGAILDAAHDVEKHWNSIYDNINQREQAKRSADILRQMAEEQGRDSELKSSARIIKGLL